MTIKALEAAKYLCKINDFDVSNMRLHKLLYICSLFFMGENDGEPLIDQHFEAWSYGPVLKNVYNKTKIFGAKNIREHVFYSTKDIDDESAEAKNIKKISNHFRNEINATLVRLTHRKNSAWYKNYMPGGYGIRIPNSDIYEEYKGYNLNQSDDKQ